MKNPDISIIIVNYNVKQFILNCLNSIYNNKNNLNITFEVIVVDNHSSDGSIDAIINNYPQVILIKNSKNTGFPTANNQAFKIAKGKYIFMLNPDTEIVDDALVKPKNYLDNNQKINIACPKLLNTDKSIQYSVWRFPKIKYIIAEMFYLNKFIKDKYYFDKNFNQSFEVESMSGAAMIFRKGLLKTIGYLDENMFWIEDIDFCYRIHKKNMKIIYLPQAEIIHHIGQSAKKNYNISIYNQTFNKIKFYKKYHSIPETVVVVVISVFNVLTRFFVFLFLSPFKKKYFIKAKAYIYTFYQIFKIN